MPLINLNPQKTQTNNNVQSQPLPSVSSLNPVNPTTPTQNLPVPLVPEGLLDSAKIKETVANKLDPEKKLQADMRVSEQQNGIKEFAPVQKEAATTNVEDFNILDISNSLESKLSNIQSQLPSAAPYPPMQHTLNELNVDKINAQKYSLAQILEESVKMNASDIHLSTGYRAIVRVDGQLKTLNTNVLSPEDMQNYVEEFAMGRNDIDLKSITEADLGYSFINRRFRVNIHKKMGTFGIVARIVPETIKSIDELELPAVLKDFARISAGLVLVTGPTGSGKSTSLASILNYINITEAKHIITLEDPIEFVFGQGLSLIRQREFGIDFKSWKAALRSALRQDPDIVLVGEMRDYETIASTITVSETGHLVFATLHTNSASQTMDRIIDVFPEAQQPQIRAQLANVITAVVSQRLVPKLDGGRKAVMEIMVATPAIKNAIREGKTHQIDNMIQTGQDYGMITMEQSLVDLVRRGIISKETAKATSIKPDEIDMLLNK